MTVPDVIMGPALEDAQNTTLDEGTSLRFVSYLLILIYSIVEGTEDVGQLADAEDNAKAHDAPRCTFPLPAAAADLLMRRPILSAKLLQLDLLHISL